MMNSFFFFHVKDFRSAIGCRLPILLTFRAYTFLLLQQAYRGCSSRLVFQLLDIVRTFYQCYPSTNFYQCQMTISDVNNCVTWLVCILQTRNRLLMMSSNTENELLNQLFLSRRQTSESFKVLSCLLLEKRRSCFKMQKMNVFENELFAHAQKLQGCGFDLRMFIRKFCSLA